MIINRVNYNLEKLYTFNELVAQYSSLLNNGYFTATSDFNSFLDSIGLYRTNFNPLGLDFVGTDDIALAMQIFNEVIEREGENYALKLKADETLDPNPFMRKVIRVLDFTFPKYAFLLRSYRSKLNDLLAKIEETSSENHTTSQSEQHISTDTSENTSRFNDTPQSKELTGGFEDDTYVSNLTKENGSNTNAGNSTLSGTAGIQRIVSSQRDTMIERLREIEAKFMKVKLSWLNEFGILFMERGNYE